MNPHIAPSILTFPLGDLRGSVAEMEACGAAWLHLDVMDGQFVPPITFGDALVKSVGQFTHLPMEAHLMTLTPERQVDAFAEAGCRRFIFHAEATAHTHRVVQAIHRAGMEAGVAINPGSSVALIEPIVSLVELVLVMTVNPGYGGQVFLPETLAKVRHLRAMCADLTIEVDGGINSETIASAKEAGANLFVVGSYLQKTATMAEAFHALELGCSLK